MFESWHSSTQGFGGERFRVGTLALKGFGGAVSVLALWHRKVEGIFLLSVSVLALRHSRVF